MTRVDIVHVLPELLGTYGDSGNVAVLAHRARLRGHTVRIIDTHPGESVPAHADAYLIGGGEDTAQLRATELLRADDGLPLAVAGGAPVLAVCAGMQIMGEWFHDRAGGRIAGLGILDLRTTRRQNRAVGDVAARVTGLTGAVAVPDLLGFENHQGATELGDGVRPLAEVHRGIGNGADPEPGRAPAEGAVVRTVIGTYLHGPVLALNPALADHMLTCILGPLDPLPDVHVRAFRLARAQRAPLRYA